MKRYVLIISALFTFPGFTQELPVSFSSDTLTLQGTLALPQGNGPFPVVVLVHATGAHDRDETSVLTGSSNECFYPGIFEDTLTTFKDLSAYFNQRDIAVLRYDKRTYTYPGQLNSTRLSPFDFIKDVNAALDYLKSRTEIDTNCIMLLGHSQGTNFLPVIARNRNDISSLMALGTPAQSIDTLMAQQIKLVYYYCNDDTLGGDAVYLNMLNDFNKIRVGVWDSNTTYNGYYPRFWNDWFRLTDSAVYNFDQVTTPTIFIHGLDDITIPIDNALRFDTQLTRSNYKVSYLPGINHLMTTSTNPGVSTIVTDSIFRWLPYCDPYSGLPSVRESNFSWKVTNTHYGIALQLSHPGDFEWVEIFDLNGKMIVQKPIFNLRDVYIPTNRWNNGLYLVRLRSSRHMESKRVILDK